MIVQYLYYSSTNLTKPLGASSTTVSVLIEEYKDGFSYGHTGNYIHVKVKGEYPSNELISVSLSTVEYPYCLGEKKEDF